jgi:hypothetical protein
VGDVFKGVGAPPHSAPLHSAPLHSAPLNSAPLHSTPLHSAYISGKNIQWSRAIREVSKCGECVIVDSCVVYPPLARRARFKVSLCPTQDLLAERGCNLVARNIFYGSVSKIAKKHKFTELNVHAGMCVEDIMRELAQLATIPTLDHI